MSKREKLVIKASYTDVRKKTWEILKEIDQGVGV